MPPTLGASGTRICSRTMLSTTADGKRSQRKSAPCKIKGVGLRTQLNPTTVGHDQTHKECDHEASCLHMHHVMLCGSRCRQYGRTCSGCKGDGDPGCTLWLRLLCNGAHRTSGIQWHALLPTHTADRGQLSMFIGNYYSVLNKFYLQVLFVYCRECLNGPGALPRGPIFCHKSLCVKQALMSSLTGQAATTPSGVSRKVREPGCFCSYYCL